MSETARRRPLSKRVRFEVFKRDSFTCQYCGRQPPEVVLHVDHIQPVASGGGNDRDNLITSCRDCNLGKSDGLLCAVSPRPDANMMLAEAAQEMAETVSYREMLARRSELERGLVSDLQDLFVQISDADWMPKEWFLLEAIERSGGDYTVVERAVRATAAKQASGELCRHTWDKFFWGCFWNAMRGER